MPLPLIPIAAGVAARYGAKKLAKYLVKRGSKKNFINELRGSLKKKSLQKTRKNPKFNYGPKGGNVMDKRFLRKFVNQENKILAKMKKGPKEKEPMGVADDMFSQVRTNIENILSDGVKNVLKHKKR